jgi:hypothetical protein
MSAFLMQNEERDSRSVTKKGWEELNLQIQSIVLPQLMGKSQVLESGSGCFEPKNVLTICPSHPSGTLLSLQISKIIIFGTVES